MYGKLPYVAHLREVVSSLEDKLGCGVDPVLIAVGWLHDVLEDTLCETSEIIHKCGVDVLSAVIALTKGHGQPYSHYIAQVKAHPVALEVKLHDSLKNLTASVMSGEKGRIKKYAKQLQLLVED
jgi:(p)ppGpp synthase/HD superfamily hydrolase